MAQRLQAFKFELMPTGEQERDMRRFAGARRYVYNKALALQTERHRQGLKNLDYAALCRELTGWRNGPETPWLADAPIQPLQQALKDLDRAFENFFEDLKKPEKDRRFGFPVFKRKFRGDAFRQPNPKQFEVDSANGRIKLPKLGWMRYRKSREVLGEVRNATVSVTAGRWYVSIQTRREAEVPVHQGGEVGIDMGVKRFATLSDGSHIEPLNSFKRHEAALAKAQRRLSRRVKFSNNWRKERAQVEKIQLRIANVRRDFLHKATTTISENQALVVMENLQVANMTKSAKGTSERQGRNVSAKSGLNKAILDQGWGEFRRQLGYKLAWNGGHLILVPPHNTSRTCPRPECGHVSADNRRTQAQFKCVACGHEDNADHVGSVNILSRGMQKLRDEGQDTADATVGCTRTAQIACEVSGAQGRQQQEPAEETIHE
jgi:putative transposase